MSGTSLDSMDGVLVDFAPSQPKVIAASSIPYPAKLKERLARFNQDNKEESFSLMELGRLEQEVAVLGAQAVNELLRESGNNSSDIQAIGFAGQTIAHDPTARYTMQCGDPNILAEMTRIPVVADLRRRDIAAGGQGAPLATTFHQHLFRNDKEGRCIVNLGGIANITLLQDNKLARGFDTGPANCLLDEWARKHLQQDYDDKGEWAASGSAIDDLLILFLEDSYFSKAPPKTTGRDYFNLKWIEGYLNRLNKDYVPRDVQATLVDLSALSISLAIHQGLNSPEEDKVTLYVAGGGVNNDYLMERIKYLVKFPVRPIEDLGVKSKQLEAISFAWLARMRMSNLAGNVPSITGAVGERVLGGIYHP